MRRIAAVCFSIVITSAIATAQPAGTTVFGQQGESRAVTERTYTAGEFAPSRMVRTRSTSASRELVVETFHEPDIEGRLAPTREIVTERNLTAPNIQQSRLETFWFPGGRRTLLEVTESLQETLANGETKAVHNTSTLDINGRLRVMSRRLEETRSVSPDVRETHITLLLPDFDNILRAAERSEGTDRVINPDQVLHRSTQFSRDGNGRWQRIAVYSGEGRGRTTELTTQRVDINGKLVAEEKIATRSSEPNAPEELVIEIHAPYADGRSPLALSERIRQTTTVTADGERDEVEEVESRNPAAPHEPLRMTRRSVTTVRQIGAGRSVTARQDFERDINGRLRVIANETTEEVR